MPGETYQIGYAIDTDRAFALVDALLGWPEEDEPRDATLVDLGSDDVDALNVGSAVNQKFGERTLGSMSDHYPFDPAMTVATPAPIAAELTNGDRRGN